MRFIRGLLPVLVYLIGIGGGIAVVGSAGIHYYAVAHNKVDDGYEPHETFTAFVLGYDRFVECGRTPSRKSVCEFIPQIRPSKANNPIPALAPFARFVMWPMELLGGMLMMLLSFVWIRHDARTDGWKSAMAWRVALLQPDDAAEEPVDPLATP